MCDGVDLNVYNKALSLCSGQSYFFYIPTPLVYYHSNCFYPFPISLKYLKIPTR